MPDDIRQSLEFNATQALDELARLDKAFNSFGSQLTTITSRFDSFNKEAGSVVSALKQMAAQADATLASLNKLGSANVSGAGAGAGVGASGAAKMSKDAQEAAHIFDQTRTPLEQYTTQVARLDALNQKGAISQDTHTRALEQARQKLDDAGKAAQGFAISWETLTRVVVTQAIVRTISALRDGIKEAIGGFLDFSKRIGEIRALDPSRTFGAIADDVRKLSDAFNQPLSRVAEAQYQTLSDQFVTAADRANILMAANMLAKVTVQDLSASVQLLTGALNAYGESSDMAGLRAAQFNLTIDLGRLRTEELGAALSRTQGIAHELGLSMEELDASLIAITIGGVKASEAATQLRSMMAALLKPSDGMKAAFQSLRVESGQAAVQTWGFQGALQQVISTTDGAANSIAKLFPNTRALPGALRLAGSGAEKYKEAMDKLRQVDVDTLRKKVTEFTSTDAERLTAELNRISNYFKTEFGRDAVHSILGIVDALGGSGGLVPVLRIVVGQLGSVVASAAGLGLVGLAFAAMKMQAALAGTAITGVRAGLLAIVGIPLAQSFGQLLGNWLGQRAGAAQTALREERDLDIKANQEKTAAAIREADRKNEEIVRGLRRYLADAQKIYFQDADNFKAAITIEEKVAKLALDRIMQSRQKMTSELFAASETAAKKAAEIPGEIAGIQAEIADRAFQTSIQRFNDPEAQFRAVAARAKKLADQAASIQAGAKDADQQKMADSAWRRADGLAKQAEQLARQTEDVNLQRQALALLDEIDGRRIGSLQAQALLQQKLSQDLEARAFQAERHNAELERQREAIEATLSVVAKDAEGNLRRKTSGELEADLAKSGGLIEKFAADLKKFGKEDFAKTFMGDTRAFASMRRELERQLTGVSIQTLVAAPEAIARLNEQLQAGIKAIRLEAPVIAKIEQVTGLDLLADGLTKVVDAYEKKLAGATVRGLQQSQNQRDLEANQRAGQGAFDKWMQERFDTSNRPGGAAERIQKEAEQHLEATFTLLKRLNEAEKITTEDMRQLDVLFSVADKAASSAFGRFAAARVTEELSTMGDAVLKRFELLKKQQAEVEVGKGQPSKIELDAIQGEIQALGQKTTAERSTTTAAKAGEEIAADTVDVIGDQTRAVNGTGDAVRRLVDYWRDVRVAAKGAAAASAAAASAASGGGGGDGDVPSMDITGLEDFFDFVAGGAVRHFDRGGFAPRGVDMVPAMLAPNEFVMSAQATRRWYSQLVAMNAGIAPSFRSQGGQVANVTVGDIHINEAVEPRQTAREVIKSLKRELRRGVSVF